MNKLTSITVTVLLLAPLAGLAAVAAEKKPLPKEDVVDVSAIGQGLCVANVFQSNMVLQRDKPLNIWGWAELLTANRRATCGRAPPPTGTAWGIAMAAQRSDDWIFEETPVKIATPADMPADNAGRYIANQLRKELEQADLERRIKEAEATITELKPALEKAQAGGKKKSAADPGKGQAGAEE